MAVIQRSIEDVCVIMGYKLPTTQQQLDDTCMCLAVLGVGAGYPVTGFEGSLQLVTNTLVGKCAQVKALFGH